METRFAGSQRLDERRRRRLAVESEGITDPAPTAAREQELSAPAGTRRIAHAHHEQAPDTADDAGSLADLDDALLRVLVPRAQWKHAVLTVVCLTVSALLLSAQDWVAGASATVGPHLARVLTEGLAAVTGWYGGLLLLAAGQFTLLTGWVRSRSSKDFDGRYHVWTRAAAVWLLFSGCLSTGAHRAATEALLQYGQFNFWRCGVLVWMLPAAALAVWLGFALLREMHDCRWSLRIFQGAAALYACASGYALWRHGAGADLWHDLFQTGLLLAGHSLLLLSMTLHARHVIYVTADPAAVARRRLYLPRPHFRIRTGWMPQIRLPRPHFAWLKRRPTATAVKPGTAAEATTTAETVVNDSPRAATAAGKATAKAAGKSRQESRKSATKAPVDLQEDTATSSAADTSTASEPAVKASTIAKKSAVADEPPEAPPVPKPKLRMRLDTSHPSPSTPAPEPAPPATRPASASAVTASSPTAPVSRAAEDRPVDDADSAESERVSAPAKSEANVDSARPAGRQSARAEAEQERAYDPFRDSSSRNKSRDIPAKVEEDRFDNDKASLQDEPETDGDFSDDDHDSNSGGNNLRGLSKKQRRRLQQEQRDRERRERR